MPLKLGKLPKPDDPRDFRFSAIRPKDLTLPKVPKPGGGYGMDFGSNRWLMLGNGPDDSVFPGFGGAGNCVFAGGAHETMESNFNAKRPVPEFNGKVVIAAYSDYSGYDANTGANDNGSIVRDVLKIRQQQGLYDVNGHAHKIGAYVSLDPGNLTELWEALWLFEAVGIGVEFPSSAMRQINEGLPWSVVDGAQIEGGHYIPLVGHPTQNVWTCVTWGQRQTMTPEFITKYCDEAWAWIDVERFNAVTGKTQQGFTDASLEQYITQLASSLSS